MGTKRNGSLRISKNDMLNLSKKNVYSLRVIQRRNLNYKIIKVYLIFLGHMNVSIYSYYIILSVYTHIYTNTAP